MYMHICMVLYYGPMYVSPAEKSNIWRLKKNEMYLI